MKESSRSSVGKESGCNAGDMGLIPVSGRNSIPWRRKGQPTPVFLPGEFNGQRSLEGYSPWCHKGSDMTQLLNHQVSSSGFVLLKEV